MQTTLNRVALVLALLGCDSKKPPEMKVGASAQSQVATPAVIVAARPELGGNLLALGEQQLELAVEHDGLVRAVVFDGQGQRIDDATVTVGVALTTENGRKVALSLARDQQRTCFWSKANVGDALGLSTIPVSVGVGGKTRSGTLSQYALLPAPRFGGQVIAVGGFGVELVATPERISAHVLDSFGEAVTRIDLELKLELGPEGILPLTWDAPSMSYLVTLDGQGDPRTRPLGLTLTADGKAHFGAVGALRARAGRRSGAASGALPR